MMRIGDREGNGDGDGMGTACMWDEVGWGRR